MRLETETGYIVSKQAVLYGYSKHLGEYAVASVVNALLAEGAEVQNIGGWASESRFPFMDMHPAYMGWKNL